MERWEIVVAGAGASGLMAARRAALSLRQGGSGGAVLLLEGNPKSGKKLLATGNGRCNLSNLGISPKHYHGDAAQAAALLSRYPTERVIGEFESLGLLCRADGEGRVYPKGNQAAAVLQCLRDGEGLPLQERCGFSIAAVSRSRGGFLLRGDGGEEIWAKRCILACGGKASPQLSQGGGYRLAEQLGHSVTPLSPSLVPLKTSAGACKALKGMRGKGRAALYQNGRKVYAESGEILFGDGRLSGICIFNLSARLRGMEPGGVEVGLDLLEDMELPEAEEYFTRLKSGHPLRRTSELFAGVLNLQIGRELTRAAGIDSGKTLGQLTKEELRRAAALAKDWRFPITGTAGWPDAQITAGGVPLWEVSLETMESKKCPGLYLAGELLDLDGDCGGYNLHWAWITGMAAGESAGRAAKGEKRSRC